MITDECIAQGRFTCQQSWQCIDEIPDRDYFLCTNKKFKCIEKKLLCDGKFDCTQDNKIDKSDEANCKQKGHFLRILFIIKHIKKSPNEFALKVASE